ncbi:hypothetical protein HPO96_28575 [Kribbella sandramycini]|uniref:Uncharacterized protein n=1 Tax=Kribbella sandramycini TaxID=60450 RepID=A0A7Y4P3J2_9ACTN|nr:hypothetical protein [Kribbella sandramycini]MBB6571561.1 hypothetical protein [Kribbella sandramycini]NOL44209.1 hypothetical protein [Kribbella sandramycini]
MTSTAPLDINAYAGITAFRETADHEFNCDWITSEHYGTHDWCPTVLEPGDPYALVVQINPATSPDPYTVIGRYCIGCGYYLFGTPEPAPITPVF